MEANGNDFRYLPFGVGRRSCPVIILALPILGITLGRLVQNFELLPPPGRSKLDTSEKGGQFSLHILKHSTIVAKPRVLQLQNHCSLSRFLHVTSFIYGWIGLEERKEE